MIHVPTGRASQSRETRWPSVIGLGTFLLLVMVCPGAVQVSDGQDMQGGLELKLIFKERSFPLDDPVITYLMFSNRSTNPIVINARWFGGEVRPEFEIRFRARAPSSRRLEQASTFIDWPRDYRGEDFRKIPAGGAYEHPVELRKFFRFTEEGSYTIEAEYANSYSGRWLGEEVWRGRLKSGAATFKLINPR